VSGLRRRVEGLEGTLRADEGMASSAGYRETDERCSDLFVQTADGRTQMGEAREPEPPDYSMFA
jgi:hypothetical protein